MKIETFPAIIGLELTLACNLRCKHCASSAGQQRKDELSTEEMLSVCKQFPDLLVQEVDLTGGEPLLRPDWFKIATYIRELNIPVRMVSNGLLLKENISALADSGIATVGISLDGLEETHDYIRDRNGLFKKVVRGIEAALAANVPVAVITAVNNSNIDELPKLHDFLVKLGIQHWQVQPLFSRGRAQDGELNLSATSFLNMGKFIHDHHVNSCNTIELRMMPADGVGYFTQLDTRETAWKGCGAGISSCGITADGKVKGCLSFPDNIIDGDLRKNDLWSIWFNENSFSYNRKFSLENLGENCIGCKFGEQCKGGCSVMSYSYTKNFHNDPYCFHKLLS